MILALQHVKRFCKVIHISNELSYNYSQIIQVH